jgi:sulfotransferase family protein
VSGRESNAEQCPRDAAIIFVGGLHRSGTSLVGRSIAEHPDASGLTGTGAYEDEGQHVQDVVAPAHALGGPGKFAFAAEARLTESSPLATDASARAMLESWRQFADPAASVLVEKSPPNMIRMRLLQSLFPAASFVVVVRHPIAVSLATQRWSHSTLDSLLRHWVRAHALLLEDAGHIERLQIVRYEDFLARPQAALDGVFGMAGMPPAEVSLPEFDVRRNDRYFWRWHSRFRHLPLRAAYLSWLARRYDEPVRRFGYRISPVEVTEPADPLLRQPLQMAGRR